MTCTSLCPLQDDVYFSVSITALSHTVAKLCTNTNICVIYTDISLFTHNGDGVNTRRNKCSHIASIMTTVVMV